MRSAPILLFWLFVLCVPVCIIGVCKKLGMVENVYASGVKVAGDINTYSPINMVPSAFSVDWKYVECKAGETEVDLLNKLTYEEAKASKIIPGGIIYPVIFTNLEEK